MADESKGLAPYQPQLKAISKEFYEVREKMADAFFKSGMWPDIKNREMALAKIAMGDALGIPEAPSLNSIVIINGKITMEARAMLAVARWRCGVSWKILELNSKACRMEFNRPGFSPMQVSFTEEDAKTAGLLGKANWKMYPEDMLFARCSKRGVNRIAPDATLGLSMSKEEAEDIEVELPKAQVVPLDSIEKDYHPLPEPEPVPMHDEPHGYTKRPTAPVVEAKPVENEDADPIEEPSALTFEPIESIPLASADQITAINMALDSLATLGRNIPELKKAIAERLVLKHGYQGVQASDVPDHLTGEQAVKVANLLVLTLEKESKKAKK